MIVNFLFAIKIVISIFLTISYYVIQTIYSNIKTDNFIIFNHNIESIETVFVDSFIIYFNACITIWLGPSAKC